MSGTNITINGSNNDSKFVLGSTSSSIMMSNENTDKNETTVENETTNNESKTIDEKIVVTNRDLFWYTGSKGAQDGGFYDRTNNETPLLPNQMGYMLTSGTPRFLNVNEQVLTVIGEGKHGMWRIQDNGYIREYRIKEKRGLLQSAEVEAANPITCTPTQLAILKNEYGAYHNDIVFGGGLNTGGYRYPSDKVDTTDNTLTFIDLPINHPKYEGKYDSHVPIDLASYYCTMSAGNEKGDIITKMWDYATKQPRANLIGPLGKRAGIDIKELYPNVIRLEQFPDADIWANVGIGADSDFLSQARWNAGEKTQTFNYQAVDKSVHPPEFYVYMRPFFNIPYMFIYVVFDNTPYIRPDGLYYQHIQDRVTNGDLSNNYTPTTTFVPNPSFTVKNYTRDSSNTFIINGMRGYGVHHPNRPKFGHNGSQGPDLGGDWGTWPLGNNGGGWPTNYQEITPIQDAIVVDLKFWWNLGIEYWNDPKFHLPNANAGTNVLRYELQAQKAGEFTDPYLVNNGFTNIHAFDTTDDNQVVTNLDDFVDKHFFIDYGRQGFYQPAVHSDTSFGLNDKYALQKKPISEGQLTEKFSITTVSGEIIEYNSYENYTLFIFTESTKPKFNGQDLINEENITWSIDKMNSPGIDPTNRDTSLLFGTKTNNYLNISEGLYYNDYGTRKLVKVDFNKLVLDN